MNEKFYIPQHLEDPAKFLFWSIDEAMAGILPLAIGLIMGLKLITLALTVICFKGWKKFKSQNAQQSSLRAFLYWHYPSKIMDMKLPDSSIKIFIG